LLAVVVVFFLLVAGLDVVFAGFLAAGLGDLALPLAFLPPPPVPAKRPILSRL
jgi:hypothetical protein